MDQFIPKHVPRYFEKIQSQSIQSVNQYWCECISSYCINNLSDTTDPILSNFNILFSIAVF